MEVYKCMNNMNPAYHCEVFNLKHLTYNLRDQNKCVIPKVRTVNMGWKALHFVAVFAGTNCHFK